MVGGGSTSWRPPLLLASTLSQRSKEKRMAIICRMERARVKGDGKALDGSSRMIVFFVDEKNTNFSKFQGVHPSGDITDQRGSSMSLQHT